MSAEANKQGGQSEEAEIKWDKQYDNPDAKIILVSSDIVGFRVDAWYFGKKSGFIRDLLDIPSTQSLEHRPQPVDAPSTTLRPFVDHIYSNAPIEIELTTEICRQLFELCHFFRSPGISVMVSRTIQLRLQKPIDRKKQDVLEIFAIAAWRDDIALARSAIASFDDAGVTRELYKLDAKTVERLGGIPFRYACDLLECRFTTAYLYDDNHIDAEGKLARVEQSSKEMAKAFAPVGRF